MSYQGVGVKRRYMPRAGFVRLEDGRSLLVGQNGAVSYRLERTLGYVWRMRGQRARWRWSGRRANGEVLELPADAPRDFPSRKAAVLALAAALIAAGETL